jgi:hypothetical protein
LFAGSGEVPSITSTRTVIAAIPSVLDSCPSDMHPSVVEKLLVENLLHGGCASSGQTITEMLKAFLAVEVAPTPVPIQIDDFDYSLPSKMGKPPKAGSNTKSRNQPPVKTMSTRVDDKGKKHNTRSRVHKV